MNKYHTVYVDARPATHPPNPHTHTPHPPTHTDKKQWTIILLIVEMQTFTSHTCKYSLTKMVYPQMSWLVMKMLQTQSQLQERIEEQHSLTSLNYSQSYYKYIKLPCSPSFTIPLSVRRMLPAFTSLCILLLSWR